jgi:hypothetical protein
MLSQLSFLPQRQFHILVGFPDEERSLAVVPNEAGKFRVIDQGKILGELNFNKTRGGFVCYKGRLKKAIITQLEKHIRNHYSYQLMF